MFADAVGKVHMGLDEGLTGWVARHKTAEFIRDKAMADPRMKYIPELEEEPSGRLRVTTTLDLGVVLADVVARFVVRHPATIVELTTIHDASANGCATSRYPR